jgi:glycosyltransferase involved in cell wall biosynthesis
MSRFGEGEMKRCGIDCFYVPHMIDCKVYSPNEDTRKLSRRQHGWEDRFVIGQVGTNVRERKNWTASLLALQKFYRHHPDVMMYCHTDAFEKRGRDLQRLRESLMLQDVTRFPSLTQLRCVGIPDTVMAAMYNSLDVYLQPSRGEGFGIPIIEAQACGVPVIVANNTTQPELCGGGWLLKKMRPEWDEQSSWEGAADPDEIYECLKQAYYEKKTGKLAQRKIEAREKAVQYDIGAVMEKHWIPVLAVSDELIKMPAGENNESRKKAKEARDAMHEVSGAGQGKT